MLIILIYISSGLFVVIENIGLDIYPVTLYYHEGFYFTIITIATVGFGDYYPQTDFGKLFVMLLIIYTVVVFIPMQTNELLRLMGLKSFYQRKLYKPNPEIPHIIITGYVVCKALKTFCAELFHQDHGSSDRHAVVIQPYDPTNEMEIFLRDPNYEFSVHYLNGNPIDKTDLERAVTEKAKVCILMTNMKSRDPIGMDHKNILTGLALKKYVLETSDKNKLNMRLCMQLIKAESKQHYKASNSRSKHKQGSLDQIIIVEEMKMNLISKSCFSPGLITLVSNLITSSNDYNDEAEE